MPLKFWNICSEIVKSTLSKKAGIEFHLLCRIYMRPSPANMFLNTFLTTQTTIPLGICCAFSKSNDTVLLFQGFECFRSKVEVFFWLCVDIYFWKNNKELIHLAPILFKSPSWLCNAMQNTWSASVLRRTATKKRTGTRPWCHVRSHLPIWLLHKFLLLNSELHLHEAMDALNGVAVGYCAEALTCKLWVLVLGRS